MPTDPSPPPSQPRALASRLLKAAKRLWLIVSGPRGFKAAKLHVVVNAFDALSADGADGFKKAALAFYLSEQLDRLHRFKKAPSRAQALMGARDERLSCQLYRERRDQMDSKSLIQDALRLSGAGSYLVTLLYAETDPVFNGAQTSQRAYRVTLSVERAPLSLQPDLWSPGARSEPELRSAIGSLIESSELEALIPQATERSKPRGL